MSDTINWSDHYSVFVPEIDKEHKELFADFNMFLGLLEKDTSCQKVSDTFSGILKKISDHFTHEEQIMEDVGFPDLIAHKEIHAKLLKDALEIASDLELISDKNDYVPYIRGIQRIVIDHVIDHDQQLIDHLKK